MTRQRTRTQIEAEVEAIAQDAIELSDMSYEEARAFVWTEFPELYDEFCKAAPEPPRVPVAKAATPTVADVVADAVHAEADRQAWTRWPDRSVEDIRVDVWLSPEGQALYALSKARGGEDWYQARLRKSADERDAWAILERWRR